MYRRYSQVGDGNLSLSQINRNRARNILIILLLAVVAALLVISIPLLVNRSSTRTQYIQQLQKECKEAITDTSMISRTAGADSAALLSRVRSNIHAMRVVNSLSGQQMVEDAKLQSMQNTVDTFISSLTTGMDTGRYATELLTALAEMQEIVGNLE